MSFAYSSSGSQEPDSMTLVMLSDIARYCGYYDFYMGNYELSRKYYTDVLDFERLKGDTINDNFYVALSQIGLTYFNERRYSESIGPMQESIGIREIAKGKGAPELISPLVSLSSAYVEFSALDKAESAARRSLDLILKTDRSKNQLSIIYYTLG